MWFAYYIICLFPKDLYFRSRVCLGLLSIEKYSYDGNKNLGKKICVFASYPTCGVLSGALKRYLENIESLGYSIIFVSTCNINEEGIFWLKGHVSKISIIENWGRDFGSYKYGILKYQSAIKKADELIIANDSVLIIRPFNEMFKEMEIKSSKSGFWGISCGYLGFHKSFHLCSYFIVVYQDVLSSDVFWKFWNGFKNSFSRQKTIYDGEVAFSLALLKHHKCLVYIDAEKILENVKSEKDIRDFYALASADLSIPSGADLSNVSWQDLLYSINHAVRFLNPMITAGMPIIKKDSLSRTGYSRDKILTLLHRQKIDFADDIVNELNPHSYISSSRIMRIIGE